MIHPIEYTDTLIFGGYSQLGHFEGNLKRTGVFSEQPFIRFPIMPKIEIIF